MPYQNIKSDNWHSSGFAAIDSGTGRNRHTILTGDANFISSAGMSVGLKVTSSSLVMAMAFGFDSNGSSIDHRRTFDKSVPNFWDLTGEADGTVYLYVDSWGAPSTSRLDFETLTHLGTSGVSEGQFRLLVSEMRVYQFNVGAWERLDRSILRVGVVEVLSGSISTVTPAGVGIELKLDDPGHLYAPLGHDHDAEYDARYAVIEHEHAPEDIGITSDTFKPDYDLLYAAIAHTHDYSAVFAPSGHNHDGVYSSFGHHHDARYDIRYSLTSHNHDTIYALSTHFHAGVYSIEGHSHSDFAPISHSHAGEYASPVHTHDYAATSHDHSGEYALATHEASHHPFFDVRYLLRSEYVPGDSDSAGVSSVDGKVGVVILSETYQAKSVALDNIDALTGEGYLERISDGTWKLSTPATSSEPGSGTVTSIGLSFPTEFSVAGSPVSSSGTISVSWGEAGQKLFLATPVGGPGAPSLRAIQANDLPLLPLASVEGLEDLLSGKADTSHNHDTTYQAKSETLTAIAEATGEGYLHFDGTNWTLEFVSGGGASALSGLSDTPDTYSGQAGKVLLVKSTEDGVEFGTVSGIGTVTSVGLSLPDIFNVANSPVSASGTIEVSLMEQGAGMVFATPSASTGLPQFRALTAEDIPEFDLSKVSGLQAVLDSKADISHVHDYAPTTHSHSEYAETSHDHDSSYSAIGHGHDYAATAHNHDTTYSLSDHAHEGIYQPNNAALTEIGALTGDGQLIRDATGTWALATVISDSANPTFTLIEADTTLVNGENAIVKDSTVALTLEAPTAEVPTRVANHTGTKLTVTGSGVTIDGKGSVELNPGTIAEFIPDSGEWAAFNISLGEFIVGSTPDALTGRYKFEAQTGNDPSSGYVRFDSIDIETVSAIYINKTDVDGVVREGLTALRMKDGLAFYDADTKKTLVFEFDSAPTDRGAVVEFAVTKVVGDTLPADGQEQSVSALLSATSDYFSLTELAPTVEQQPGDGTGSVLVNKTNGEVYVNARDETSNNLWFVHTPDRQVGYSSTEGIRNWADYQQMWLDITDGAVGGAVETNADFSWKSSIFISSYSRFFISDEAIYDTYYDKKIDYATGVVSSVSAFSGHDCYRGMPADSGFVYWVHSDKFYRFNTADDTLSVIPSAGLSGHFNCIESPVNPDIVYLFTLNSGVMAVYRHDLSTDVRELVGEASGMSVSTFFRWGADDKIWMFNHGTKEIVKFDPAIDVVESKHEIVADYNFTSSHIVGLAQSGRMLVSVSSGDLFSVSPDLSSSVKIWDYVSGGNYGYGYSAPIPLHSGEVLLTLITNTIAGNKFIGVSPDGLSAYPYNSTAQYKSGYRCQIMPDGKIMLGESTVDDRRIFDLGYSPDMPAAFTTSRFHNPLGYT